MVTDLPALDTLSNPHLLVAGAAWRDDAVRVITHRMVTAGARVTYLGQSRALGTDRPWAHDLSALDLTDALGASTDAYQRLRGLVRAIGGPSAIEAAAAIDSYARNEAVRVRTPMPMPGVAMVRARLPADAGLAAGILDDLVNHAHEMGLPAPTCLVGVRRQAVALTRDGILDGAVPVTSVLVEFAVRHDAGGGEDWRPYAAQGMTPDVSRGDLLGAIEVAEVALRANPKHQRVPAEELRALAEDLVRDDPWTVAIQVARRGTRAGEVQTGMRSVLAAIDELPAAKDAVRAVRAALGGPSRLPTWWSTPITLIGSEGSTTEARLATVVESLLDRATVPQLLEVPKALLIDDDRVLRSELGREAITRILRLGRKHNIYAIVFANALDDLSSAFQLLPNWLVHHQIAAEHPGFPSEAPEGVMGWIRAQASEIHPISRWWSSEEVASGERLLTGIDITPSAIQESAS